MELYNGSLLFPTHDEVEHLAMIEKTAGWIPKWMGSAASRELADVFDMLEEQKEGGFMRWP